MVIAQTSELPTSIHDIYNKFQRDSRIETFEEEHNVYWISEKCNERNFDREIHVRCMLQSHGESGTINEATWHCLKRWLKNANRKIGTRKCKFWKSTFNIERSLYPCYSTFNWWENTIHDASPPRSAASSFCIFTRNQSTRHTTKQVPRQENLRNRKFKKCWNSR